MAESLGLKRSIDKSSENAPDKDCEKSYELNDETKVLSGQCVDCGENLYVQHFHYHLRPKPFRNNKLVHKCSKPQTKPKYQKRDVKTCKIVKSQRLSQTVEETIHCQMAKRPEHVTDINTKSASDIKGNEMYGYLALPENQILISDFHNKKLKQFDSVQGKLVCELQLSGKPIDITKVKSDEVAVTVEKPHHIQLVSVSEQSLQKGKTFKLQVAGNTLCRGIAYNDKDQTFIITLLHPAKVEIINMTGTVLKTLDNNSIGAQLFSLPFGVALSPDMNSIYIVDAITCSVTLLTLGGDVKAVFKDSRLQYPSGLYVHKSGLVYVVDHRNNTICQLDPDSGEFKLVLEQKDGLESPWNITYCEVEDKLYVGMRYSSIVKVFKLK